MSKKQVRRRISADKHGMSDNESDEEIAVSSLKEGDGAFILELSPIMSRYGFEVKDRNWKYAIVASTSPQWTTTPVLFHGFAGLDAQKGSSVNSPEFESLGHKWSVELYPGGDDSSSEGLVSLYLCNRTAAGIEIDYGFSIVDSRGAHVKTIHSSEEKKQFYPAGSINLVGSPDDHRGFGHFAKRSDILASLANGTFSIEVQMRPPPSIIFQVDKDGTSKQIYSRDWNAQVRTLPESFRSHHPAGADAARAAPYNARVMEGEDGENITLQSITALPVYAGASFEELRLRDYLEGNKGLKKSIPASKYRGNDYKGWGGSDINRFFEVDLGTKRVVLRRPAAGMYTKQQSLNIIKMTTFKSSKERGGMIQFLLDNKLVPNQSALYRVIRRDEEGRQVYNDNWVKELTIEQKQMEPIVWQSSVWESCHQDNLPCFPRPKKRVIVGDETIAKEQYASRKTMDEYGWKGSIRLGLCPVKFPELQNDYLSLSSNIVPIDICSYIGTSEIRIGFKIDWEQYDQRDKRICRLYFDPRRFPPPNDIKYGGNCVVANELRNYIHSAAIRDGSPVVCEGATSNDHKMFRCNKKFTDCDGKRRGCPFRFQIRWDHSGYYVHLLKNPERLVNCGEAWHCCKL